MPQHKSCKKRMKTSEADRMQNRAIRSQLAKSMKELKGCQTKSEANNRLRDVISIIDRACQKNIIHKNKAARDKSIVMSFVNKLSD